MHQTNLRFRHSSGIEQISKRCSGQRSTDNQESQKLPSEATQKLIKYLMAEPGVDIRSKLRSKFMIKKGSTLAQKQGNSEINSSFEEISTNMQLSQPICQSQKQYLFDIANHQEKLAELEQNKAFKYYSPTKNQTFNYKSPIKNQNTKSKKSFQISPFVAQLLKAKKQKKQQKQQHQTQQKVIELEKQTTSQHQFTQINKKKLDELQKKQCLTQLNESTRSQLQVSFVVQCPQFMSKGLFSSPKQKNEQDVNSLFLHKLSIKDFHFIKDLGQGTFGTVHAVIYKPTNFLCTMKKYSKQIIRKHELQSKFIKDIKNQLRISHHHIVKLYGFFSDKDCFYKLYEYMQSGNLDSMIKEKGGNLPQIEIFRTVSEINQALLYLHEDRYVHRDIKPDSVLTCLVCFYYNVCKIGDTDWIIKKSSNGNQSNGEAGCGFSSSACCCSTLCREIDYIAPQALEGKQITQEFDIWGLGLIAFEMLTGRKLIKLDSQKKMIQQIVSITPQLVTEQIHSKCSQLMKFLISRSLEPIPRKRLNSLSLFNLKDDMIRESTSTSKNNSNLSYQSLKGTATGQRSPTFVVKIHSPQLKTKNTSPTSSSSPIPKLNFTNLIGVKKQINKEVTGLL